MLLDNTEPTSYGEAMVGPYSAIRSHEIRDKGIFEKKTDVDGNVTVYETRLVAKSFSQVQGVDYDEIFSSVAMLKSIGIMLA